MSRADATRAPGSADATEHEVALAARLPGAPRARRVLANRLSHHVLEWGAGGEGGETILLCHGFLDVAASFARTAAALAQRGHRVLAFDWRGHGKTDWVGAGGYYHFPDYALDLAELTAALELPRTHLVGHSMGGTAATLYASARPEGLASLVSIEGLGPPESDDLERRLGDWLAGVARLRERPPRPLRGLDEAVLKLCAQHGDLGEALARELVPFMTREDADGALYFAFDPLHKTRAPTAFQKSQYVRLLAAIAVPTLVVTGSEGFRTPDHEERKGAIPRVREEIVLGATHMIHWHHPERLAALIDEHVRGNR